MLVVTAFEMLLHSFFMLKGEMISALDKKELCLTTAVLSKGFQLAVTGSEMVLKIAT